MKIVRFKSEDRLMANLMKPARKTAQARTTPINTRPYFGKSIVDEDVRWSLWTGLAAWQMQGVCQGRISLAAFLSRLDGPSLLCVSLQECISLVNIRGVVAFLF
jgi:hypothetical protein